MNTLRILFSFASIIMALPALAHEFWIDAAPYAFPPNSSVTAELRNGQMFSGMKLPYIPNSTARFDVHHAGETFNYSGRIGDFPAFQSDGFTDGLVTVVHETMPSTITYTTLEKFRRFVQEKGRPDILDRHRELGLPVETFKENYTRHAKALIAVGSGAGADVTLGMKTEFTAISNPYDQNFTGVMTVELRLDGILQTHAPVSVFDKNDQGHVSHTLHRTDDQGQVHIDLSPGHQYLLDSVAFSPAPDGSEALWETYWAALTFAAPE
ncbi:DUF4198 domain-containing protein [Phaeobacter sp. B1627]|uniref:DUF4198 domain-containing protein n=1 Tax=Phaeobacter sp. B1627 TaxID=2583809 RepID=UPI001117E3C3|nr:DUF4198 domain-containing protein [Phaeobacter sp. B1627]TNJ41576.1 DUF4198 domain-containing protein [Phaeobacter sp. B1627]